jgi:3-hydroxymyristoyl/3-hydroxydecanoyl-(acyl carrier protein) dehydratase
MSSVAISTDAPGLIDIAATFLPVGQMRQIARVTSIEGPVISGEMELGSDHWVWPEHFPGDPIFPGTLMIEGAGQLVALWAWSQGHRGRPRLVRTSAEFISPVGLDTRALLLKAEVKRKRHLYVGRIEVYSEDLQVARIEALLVVLPAA